MPHINPIDIWDEVKDYFFIFLGCLMYSIGFCLFLLPYKFIPGGCTGISALIYYGTGIPTQYSYFIINAILLLIGLKVLGFKYFAKTIYAVVLITILLEIIQGILNVFLVTILLVQTYMTNADTRCVNGDAV